MPLISEQLPNLMNGVSQQAITMRMSSQASEQINGFSSVVEGVNKRPPTKHVAKIINGTPGQAYVHTIDRDGVEKYEVIVLDGQLKVFDLEGNEKTVTAPNGLGYLADANPRSAFKAVTINDYTFFINTNTDVAKAADLSAARGDKKLLFVKGVNYGVDFNVKLDGVEVASFSAPSSDTAPKIATDIVASGLHASLVGLADARFTYTLVDNLIVIEQVSGAAARWEFNDTFTGIYTEMINPQMQRFTSLPTTAPQGFEVEITGDISTEFDNYFLRFETTDGSNTVAEGQWVETVAPELQYKLDENTMPHTLVRNGDGTFTFDSVVWGDRTVGNEDSAPWPSFVGSPINDAYLDRNRLCFLSGSNVIMSRPRALFEFFPTTVTTQLDDGPIDVAASGSNVSTLRSAVAFNKQVILFGDQTQFTIDVDLLLASAPPAIEVLTDYETDKQTVPVAVGKTLYFTVTRGRYTSVMEYYVVEDSDTTDAADVSRHVPTYVPSGAFKLAASPTSDVVVALTDAKPNSIYVYKYYWRKHEKLQSSWSRWDFADDAVILNIDFIKDQAVLVVQYPDGVYIETMEVSEGQSDTDSDFVYHLDRRLEETDVTQVYDGATQRTTLTLPYVPSTPSKMLVVTRPGGITALPAATTVDIVSVSGNVIVVDGDMDGVNLYIGELYTFEYTFSQAVLKKANASGGLATITGGRLQLHKWYVVFDRTGYFRAEVSADNRDVYTYVWTGKVLGTSQAVIGTPSITSGTFGFRINSKSDRVTIKLINDGFLPSYFTAAEWEGRYVRRTSQ